MLVFLAAFTVDFLVVFFVDFLALAFLAAFFAAASVEGRGSGPGCADTAGPSAGLGADASTRSRKVLGGFPVTIVGAEA